MCLFIDESKHPKLAPRIAKGDIRVYKILSRNNKSPHYGFSYAARTGYATRMSFGPTLGPDCVESAFHAYRSKRTAFIEKGLINIYIAKVVSFTIPKGSDYFVGLHDEICANRICSGPLTALREVSP